MSDQIQDDVELKFDVNEGDGVRKINSLAHATDRLGSLFDRVTGAMTLAGGIGGVMAIGETIGAINETYRAVGRLKAMTGMAAGQAHAMLDAFELSGVEATTSERMIMMMARHTREMEDGAGQHAESMAAQFKRMGIDLKKGPVESLLQMSKAAESGKVTIDQIVKLFGIPKSHAADMMKMLQKGPAAIKGIMDDTLHSGDLINESALASFERMQQAKREMKDSWEGVVGIIYKQLLPVVARFMSTMKEGFDKMMPVVERVGEFLVAHMETAVALAKTFGKLMIANKLLGMTTGQGLAGNAKRLAGWAFPKAIGGAGKAIGVGALEGGQALSFLGMGLARLAGIGAVIMLIVAAFKLLAGNVNGIRDRLVNLFNEIMRKFEGVGTALKPILDVLGEFVMSTAMFALDIFEGVLFVVNKILVLVQALGIMVAKIVEHPLDSVTSPLETLYDSMNEAEQQNRESAISDQIKKAREARAAAMSTPDGRGGTVINQDFSGSHFDIKQQFAEGFDPDRIAVTIGDDLMRLGERGQQSNLAPVFAVR